MMPASALSTPWTSIANGVKPICPNGWAMGAFDYRQAEEIRDSFARLAIRYLFIGKSGAILLGYPDTTQDADLYVEKETLNCQRLVDALSHLGFRLTEQEKTEVLHGKDF